MLLTSVSIWFEEKNREPPDKHNWNILIQPYEWFVQLVLIIEDVLFLCKIDIDICYILYVTVEIIRDKVIMAMKYLGIDWLLRLSVNNECMYQPTWTDNTNKSVRVYEVNSIDDRRFRRRRIVTSNIILSLSAQGRQNGIE
jgi:hypothetical protein